MKVIINCIKWFRQNKDIDNDNDNDNDNDRNIDKTTKIEKRN